MRQAAPVGRRPHLEGSHESAEVRLGEARLAAREALESVEGRRGLAPLEEAHSREQVDLPLLLGRQREHLEAARRRIEHPIRELVAAGRGDLQHQAVGPAGEEPPPAAHGGRGAPSEAPGRGGRVVGRLVPQRLRLRGTFGRALAIGIVGPLLERRDPLLRRVPAGRRLRRARQREGADLHLHSGPGDVCGAFVGDLPAFRGRRQGVLHSVQDVLHLHGSVGRPARRRLLGSARGTRREQRGAQSEPPHWRCSGRRSSPPTEW